MSERFSDRVLICINFSMIFALLAVALTGCNQVMPTTSGSTAAAPSDPLLTEMARIDVAGVDGLNRVIAIASVPNPNLAGGIEDQHGLTCAQAGVSVFNQMKAVNAAGQPITSSNGLSNAIVYGELLTLFKPGSPQYESVLNTIEPACLAKARDVVGPAGVAALAVSGGVVAAMVNNPAILPIQ